MNRTRPATFQRRNTSPYHMPYRKNATSSTNEVSQVWYHGPSRIHGIRKKCSETPHPPVARSTSCSSVSAEAVDHAQRHHEQGRAEVVGAAADPQHQPERQRPGHDHRAADEQEDVDRRQPPGVDAVRVRRDQQGDDDVHQEAERHDPPRQGHEGQPVHQVVTGHVHQRVHALTFSSAESPAAWTSSCCRDRGSRLRFERARLGLLGGVEGSAIVTDAREPSR